MNNKELLKQYVDTGLKLPEYQVKSLTDNLRNTYIRKRLIAVDHDDGVFADYEFELLTPEQRLEYNKKSFQHAMKMAENGGEISYKKFELLTPEQRFEYVMKFSKISDYQFELLTPEQQKMFKDKGGNVFY